MTGRIIRQLLIIRGYGNIPSMSQEFNSIVEISLAPTEATDAHIQGLLHTAASIGATATVRSEELLTAKALAASSEELWETPVYGIVAGTILKQLRWEIEVKGRVFEERGAMQLTVPALGLKPGDALLGRASMPPNEALVRASQILGGLISPFPLILIYRQFYSTGLDVVCKPPTIPLTAEYFKHKRLTEHTQMGATGKGLDTITHAVGLPLPEDYKTKREYAGSYMGRRRLLGDLKAQDLPAVQITALEKRIAEALNFQGQHGHPKDSGQIIIEVGPEPSNDLLEAGWDMIALESLGVLAKLVRKGSRMAEFLKQLATQA